MNIAKAILSAGLLAGLAVVGPVPAGNITPSLASIDVMHNGKKVTITRTEDKAQTIPKAYQKTARRCPPFCVQPAELLPGVQTLGELEVLGYLKRMTDGDKSVLVVDSRTPDWTARGTIPGSVNIPWNKINIDVDGTFAVEAEAESLGSILKDSFGAAQTDNGWDFSNARTLVMFCNGIWCPQSSANIKTLAKMGYPLHKLKWYRGGMQDWVSVGLTTVTP